MFSEISQRERQILSDVTSLWNLKKKKKPKANAEAEQIGGCQSEEEWGVGEMSKGVKRYKLPVIKVNKFCSSNIQHGD